MKACFCYTSLFFAYFCHALLYTMYDFEQAILPILKLHIISVNGCSLIKEINSLREEINTSLSKGMFLIKLRKLIG